MEWTSFKCLFSKVIFCYVWRFFIKYFLVIKIWQIMTAITNTNNLRQYKSRIAEILEQKLNFVWSSNIAKKVTNKSPNFKQTALQCFELLNVLIRIDRPSLSLTFKQFQQWLYSNSLSIGDITCYFF